MIIRMAVLLLFVLACIVPVSCSKSPMKGWKYQPYETGLRAGRMIWVVLTVVEDKTPGLREKSKEMKRPLETIIRRMVDSVNGNRPLSGLAAADQFRPKENGNEEVARNLNAAFLIVLSGSEHFLV